ncbi:MAG: triose-phosphate isomerase [bacterium]
MRKPLVAGNWKMHGTSETVRTYLEKFSVPPGLTEEREFLICPPFTALAAWKEHGRSKPYVMLGGQDAHWEEKGAYTGEVSPGMLRDAGCAYCIVGHSERRAMFHETDEMVNRKMNALLGAGLTPVVCVGETLAQREAGETESVLRTQVEGGILTSKGRPDLSRIVMAYEPVWAIGTGRTATARQADEACGFIRRLLREALGEAAAASVRILYGGSVKGANIDELMAQPEVDGVLVGGASLDPDEFSRIAAYGTGR